MILHTNWRSTAAWRVLNHATLTSLLHQLGTRLRPLFGAA